MKTKSPDYSKRTLLVVGSIATAFCIFISVVLLSALDFTDETNAISLQDNSFYGSAAVEISDLSSEHSKNSSDINVNVEVSDIENEEPVEIEHGWVINEFGYTYLYGDSGFQQFNYKQSALERYVDCVNALSTNIPENTDIYNILVPISTTFADIPREIYKEDNFFNLSQSSFVATVNTKLDEKVTSIPIVNELETAYDNGENVFFRTDSNWTSLGAYKGYVAFCESIGFAPFPLETFVSLELGDFLGCYYRSTNSEAMLKNPDSFVCYSVPTEISTALTVYDKEMVFPDYKLCDNHVTVGNKYNFYLGREAGRYSLSTNSEGGSLLIIGDSSVGPILPFLAAHYKEIEYINPLKYNKSLIEFIEKYDFDNVLTMCYTTNAVSGSYIPSLMSFSGEINE